METDRIAGNKSRSSSGKQVKTLPAKKARAAYMMDALAEKKAAGAVATTLNYPGKKPVTWRGIKVEERTATINADMVAWMKAQGVRRQQAARKFRQTQVNVSNDHVELSQRWAAYVKALPEDEKFGLGADVTGLAKRAALFKEGFHTSTGGMGKYRPYYIENGILRGGITGRGRETENGGFAIPASLSSDPTRKLQSVMAKYTDPSMFPSSRMVKYVRGHWGSGAHTNEMHGLW